MVAIRKETLVWLGPTTSETLEADFKNFFARRCCVDGSVFAGLDSEDNIAEHRFSRGRAGIDKSMVMHTELKALFSPPGRRRAHHYMQKFKHFAGPISNSMVFDNSQNPSKRCRAGLWLPTLQRGSEMVVMKGEYDKMCHMLTHRELAFSQGWPALNLSGCKDYADAIGFDVHSLPSPAQASLMGNSMHLAALMSWVAYVFSHVARRDVLLGMHVPLRTLAQPAPDDMPEEDSEVQEGMSLPSYTDDEPSSNMRLPLVSDAASSSAPPRRSTTMSFACTVGDAASRLSRMRSLDFSFTDQPAQVGLIG